MSAHRETHWTDQYTGGCSWANQLEWAVSQSSNGDSDVEIMGIDVPLLQNSHIKSEHRDQNSQEIDRCASCPQNGLCMACGRWASQATGSTSDCNTHTQRGDDLASDDALHVDDGFPKSSTSLKVPSNTRSEASTSASEGEYLSDDIVCVGEDFGQAVKHASEQDANSVSADEHNDHVLIDECGPSDVVVVSDASDNEDQGLFHQRKFCETYNCDQCEKKYFTKDLLRKHLNLAHFNPKPSTADNVIIPNHWRKGWLSSSHNTNEARNLDPQDLNNTGFSANNNEIQQRMKSLKKPQNSDVKRIQKRSRKRLHSDHQLRVSTNNTSDEDNSEKENFSPDNDVKPTMEDFHRGLPVFCSGKTSPYTHMEVADILLNPPLEKVCTSVPSRVQNNMTFIVDLEQLDSEGDITADDNGAYRSSSARAGVIITEQTGNLSEVIYAGPEGHSASIRTGTKVYRALRLRSTCASSSDFKRWIYRLKPSETDSYYRYCLLQYYFESDVHDFAVCSHANAKKENAPRKSVAYKQTAVSVRKTLYARTSSLPPKEALHQVNTESGGMLAAQRAASIPRNYKQVENFRQKNAAKTVHQVVPNDVLATMMQQCKATINVPGKCFIRDVKGAPEPACVVGTEKAFREVERFCCAERPFNSVLSIDPTFKLGDFYLTPTTYKNKSLIDRRTEQNPLFLGPCLVHQRKEFRTYHYFASTLTGIKPQLTGLKAFGTDGEEALVQGFDQVFKEAHGLRDRRHCKQNIVRKLEDMRIPSETKDEILKDIFGYKLAGVWNEGLIDAKDAAEFYSALEDLANKWPKEWFDWFEVNISPYMSVAMTRNVRETNGIQGYFYSNMSESINALIKRKTNHKAHELSCFLKKLKEIYDQQEEEVRRAFCGEGDYILSREFAKFQLGEKYFELQGSARQRHETCFYQAQYVPCTDESDTELNDSSIHDVQPESDHELTAVDTQFPELKLQGLTHTQNLRQKCLRLLSQNMVKPAFKPGEDFFVKSDSGKPHYVEREQAGKYTCDKTEKVDGCLGFKQSKICSHILACAYINGDFRATVDTYNASARGGYNLTNVAMHNIKAGAGRKSGNVRRRNKAFNSKGAEVNSLAEKTKPGPIKVTIRQGARDLESSVEIPEDPSKPYKLVMLTGHPRVRTCSGCKCAFVRTSEKDPHNLCLQRKERPTWVDGNGVLRTGKLQFVYYHVSRTCVHKQNADFLTEDIDYFPLVPFLSDEQKRYLHRQMALTC